MKRNLTRAICAMSAAVLLFTAGCSSKNGADSSTQVSTSAAQDSSAAQSPAKTENVMPIVKDGSVTLTIGAFDNWYTPASYKQNLPIWKAIEEKTGVKINWDVVPSAQYIETMTVRLAAMQNVPDLFTIPGDPVKFGEDGVLEPLEGLIDQYASNMQTFFAENPKIYNLLKAPNGHVYFVSSVTSGVNMYEPQGHAIRKDWLDKLNLPVPETLDDWYNVLKAFKEKDPNENGKPDEIPLVLSDYSVAYTFGNAWGLHHFVNGLTLGFFPDKEGKVQCEWLDPRSKEMVKFLNTLYKDGLLDPEYLTGKYDQFLSKNAKDIVGASYIGVSVIDQWDKNLQDAGVKDANWIAVKPPKGPNGYPGHGMINPPVSGYFGMSANSKNKEVAIKWLDYVYASEEGNRFTTFGIEGKSYVIENGEPMFTDFVLKNPDGLNFFSALRILGAAPTLPWIRNDKGPLSKQPAQMVAGNEKLQEQIKKLQPSLIESVPFGFILMTPEEAAANAPLTADFKTKLDEKMANFITGVEDIDSGWDKFTSELKSLGVDELTKIKQQQYDRYTK